MGSLLVLVLAAFCWTKSLPCNDAFEQRFRYSEVLPEDLALFASQIFQFPASRLDDVPSRLDAHLSIVPAVRTTCHIVRTTWIFVWTLL
jgi:hypothetical protein